MTYLKKGFSFINAYSVSTGIAIALSAFAFSAHAETLVRQLEQGMSGADVSSLQTFLAMDPTIYPQGRVTGYFGPLTFSAVSNFQARNGISAVGRVGPITRSAINNQMLGIGGSVDKQAPLISSVSTPTSPSSATVSWSTSEDTQGTLYYSTIPLYMSENVSVSPTSVVVSGTAAISASGTLRRSHTVNVQNLQSNTTYYYVIHATDQADNVSVTWPSTFQTNN
jgi:peptidoglycan hydrolase-like protein with peptidoglycan-binding domain